MKDCLPTLVNARSPLNRVSRYFPGLLQACLVFIITSITCINAIQAGEINSKKNNTGHLFIPPDKIPSFRAITRKVTNGINEPLSAVSVNLKNSKTGTTTNENGDYTINIPDNTGTLIFTHIGF